MINTELRLGNLMEVDNKVMIIRSISYEEITAAETDERKCPIYSDDGYDFEPIPITSEKLGKAMFKKGGEIFYKEIEVDGWRIELEETDKWDVFIRDEEGNATILCSIENVHELQNIWFAITKEELEIKL